MKNKLISLILLLTLGLLSAIADQTYREKSRQPFHEKELEASSPFIKAIRSGDIKKTKAFLKNGANPNPQNSLPIIYAVESNNTKIVELLLDAGANAEIALISGSASGKPEIVKLILNKNTGAARAKNSLALYLAVQRGDFEIVKMLYENDADPYAENGRAIEAAHQRGHTKILRLFLGDNYNNTYMHDIL